MTSPRPLLDIAGLTVEFAGRDFRAVAVRDASLQVARGEVLGVVGESGAGKSSVGAAVMDLLEPPGKVVAGRLRLDGEDLPLGDPAKMRAFRGRRIGAIFQDPLTSLDPLFTVADQLSETLRCHRPGLSSGEARKESVNLLREVGVADAERRAGDYPHQFSGGMRQRVVIALALAGGPDLLVADEPTTALDVSVQARILKLLRRQTAERGVGVMLITHDMGVVAETADRVAVMRGGEIVESAPASELFRRPRHPYTRALLAAVPPADRKLRRFQLPADDRPESDRLDHESRRDRLMQTRTRPDDSGNHSGTLLEVRGLRKTFGGGFFSRAARTLAVDEVNFAVNAGESFGLVGESGSGKSTVARIIAGLTVPDSGSVVFAGRDLSEPRARADSRRAMQMIFQDPYSSLNPRLRVGFSVAEPLLIHERGLARAQVAAKVDDLLALVGLPPESAEKWPHEFSGGQRQRIAVARALATAPKLLICDEPTSSLDVSVQARILNLMKDLQERLGLALLFISHDLPVVRQMCDRVGVLKNGRLLECRKTDDLFSSPQTDYAAELLKLVPRAPALDNPPGVPGISEVPGVPGAGGMDGTRGAGGEGGVGGS